MKFKNLDDDFLKKNFGNNAKEFGKSVFGKVWL